MQHRWHDKLVKIITEEYGDGEVEGEHDEGACELVCLYFEHGLDYTDDAIDRAIADEVSGTPMSMYANYLFAKWWRAKKRGIQEILEGKE